MKDVGLNLNSKKIVVQRYFADKTRPQQPEAGIGGVGDHVDSVDGQQGRAGGWMTWAQYISMGQRHDYRPALAAVDAPVLVLHGADDLQSEAASRLYVEALPNAEFVVIEDAGHASFEEQPEAFARVVAEFLNGLN